MSKLKTYNVYLFAIWLLTGLVCPAVAGAQTTETCIHGSVGDDAEQLAYASVIFLKDGMFRYGVNTDFKGQFTLHGVEPGEYAVVVTWGEMVQARIRKYEVFAETNPILDIRIPEIYIDDEGPVAEEEIHRISIDSLFSLEPGTRFILSESQIRQGGHRTLGDLAMQAGGVHQAEAGEWVSVKGADPGHTGLNVDGARVDMPLGIPLSAIRRVEVRTGGIPAEYGGFSGGLMLVETRGGISGDFRRKIQ